MKLTIPQTKIFTDNSRFRVVVAGRRFGKTFLSVAELAKGALSGKDKNCWYIAPTYKSAKDIAWDMLISFIPPEYIAKRNESDLTLKLLNGSKISLKGAEKPDNLRGRSLDLAVLDEFADMKPEAWFEVIRPSLSDRQGSALFIGTPKGRNHFYDLWTTGIDGQQNWGSFQYTTLDGGNVPAHEIESAKSDLDERTFKQEYLANFVNYSGIIYYNFSREDSVKRFTGDYNEVHIGMDFNLDPMSACVAVKNGGHLHLIDEIVMYSSNTDEMADEIKQRYPNCKITIYPDPACKQRKTSAGGRTDLSILQNAGLGVLVKSKHPSVRDRLNSVNARLKNADGNRFVYIDPKCKETIKGLERQTYKEGTNQPNKDGYDHMNDALGYMIEYMHPIRKEYDKSQTQRWS